LAENPGPVLSGFIGTVALNEKLLPVQVWGPVRYAFSWYKYVSLNRSRGICI